MKEMKNKHKQIISFVIVVALFLSCLHYQNININAVHFSIFENSKSGMARIICDGIDHVDVYQSEETNTNESFEELRRVNRAIDSILIFFWFVSIHLNHEFLSAFARNIMDLKTTCTHVLLMKYIHRKDGKHPQFA